MSGLWDRLAGQPRVRAALEAAAPAPGDSYLFVGPPGVGKRDAARAFAAAVLCPDRCGACPVCSRVLRGVHPDVQVYEPEGFTFPVELVREMVASAAQTPMEAPRRLTIVEAAHRIAERSQNALLKALEEPNPSLTWVLVADALEPFLPTIVSRCRVVEFSPVPEEAVRSLVEGRFDLDPGRAAVIVRAARGDVERAVALASDERARGVRSLALDAAAHGRPTARWALGVAERVQATAREAREAAEEGLAAELAGLEETLGTGRGSSAARKRVAERSKRMLRRVELEVFLDFVVWLAEACRDLAALSSGASPAALASPDRTEDLEVRAPARPAAFWMGMVDAAAGARLAILENAQPGLVLESLLLGLASGYPSPVLRPAGVPR